jgi:2-phospho-L-lactate guanylyltransferase
MTTRALIPLKRLDEAKSRLAPVLPAAERRALVLQMVRHVIGVVRGGVDEAVLLATEPVPELGDIPALFDAAEGLNASIASAVRSLNAARGDVVLVVFADLPLLAAADIAALVEAAAQGFAIAPDRLDVGVNAVGFCMPREVQFRFGPGSRQLFEAEATRLGLAPVFVRRPNLALDIDDGESLALYRARAGAAFPAASG